MTDSPLFPNFNRILRERQAALRAWLKTQQQLEARKRSSRTGQPERYAAKRPSVGGGNWLWNSILSQLGPVGSIVDAMLRPNGEQLAPSVDKEIEAAQNLLASFGYDVTKRGEAAGLPEIVRELVDEKKEKPKEGTPKPGYRGDVMPRRTKPPAEKTDETVEQAEGLVEGMIPVRSSNVHSIGFAWRKEGRVGDLLVRFLGGDGKHRSGPGPLYRYKSVDRSVFDAFKRASSKGSFVWDNLRVRGTISGHEYSYELAGVGDDEYVPRQAGLKRGQKGEFFMPRNFNGRRSTLPEQQVRGTRQPLVKNFRDSVKKVDFRAGRR